jgi:hypothetical protein
MRFGVFRVKVRKALSCAADETYSSGVNYIDTTSDLTSRKKARRWEVEIGELTGH